jgi:hypothetical protein
LLDSNNMKELVDPSLDVGYDPEEMAHILAVASMCIHHSSSSRPVGLMPVGGPFLEGG